MLIDLARLSDKFGGPAPQFNCLTSPAPMLPTAVSLAFGRTTARAVHPADNPAPDSRRLAGLACGFGLCMASGRAMGLVHGVGVTFHPHAAPLRHRPYDSLPARIDRNMFDNDFLFTARAVSFQGFPLHRILAETKY